MVRIWGIVIAVHAALLALMVLSYDRPNMPWNKKPVVIRTVLAAAPRPKAPSSAHKTTGGKETVKASPKKTTSAPAAAPAKTPSPQKAPPPKNTATVAVTQPSKKPAAPKKAEPVPQHLLEELEASLTKIESKPNKFSGKKSADVPKFGHSLQIDRLDNLDSKETEYQMELVSFLHEALHLPEFGEVKMEITVRPDGSVASVKVLEAQSSKK